MRISLISLDPWDDVWRRNQHLASRLLAGEHVQHITYVAPPTRSGAKRYSPLPGVLVVTPALRCPKRLGGLLLVGRLVRRWTRTADLLWINDPVIGRMALRQGQPALYDVTDDWREAVLSAAERRRLVRGEDELAKRARTVVCSEVLAERWRERYAVLAGVVRNGVDLDGVTKAPSVQHDPQGPHLGYVGTLHDERLDVDLLVAVADMGVGTVHLVGPDSLSERARRRLRAAGVRMHGSVASPAVPGWLRSFDVLLSPHRITPFTMSLDAIKSYEYLASGRPIVATSTSGFQEMTAPGLTIGTANSFLDGVRDALRGPREFGTRGAVGWTERAAEFARQLVLCQREAAE